MVKIGVNIADTAQQKLTEMKSGFSLSFQPALLWVDALEDQFMASLAGEGPFLW